MKLSELIRNIEIKKSVIPDADIDISSVCFDSRKAVKGAMFVAQKGTKSDGHAYISSVIENGSSAILCEDLPSEI